MKLRIIPTSEGYFDAVNNQYIYNYTDHLGNVRLSYSDTNKDGIIQPRQYNNASCTGGTGPFDPLVCIDNWKPGEIVEVNNYYPFGMLHNYTITTQNPYQYKYNGKELQETGMYAMDFRHYMPDIGRFTGMDALAESYADNTPFHFSLNNPANYSDPTGMYTRSADGNIITTSNQGEINELFNYFKGGGSVSGMNGFIKQNSSFAIDLEGVVMAGQGGGSSGLDYVKSDFNSAVLGSGIQGAQANWNTQQAMSKWQTDINETEIGKSIGNLERFLFLDMPMQFAGGALLSAGWKAIGAGRYLSGIANNLYGRIAPRILPQVYTKSSLAFGRQMHAAYKLGDVVEGVAVKEFRGIPGIRPDFVNFSTKTIYELKPYNPKQIQLGTQQLLRYKNAFEARYPGTVWNTILDTY